MSKLTKKPVILPSGVTITQDGFFAVVHGTKGDERVKIPDGVVWAPGEGGIRVSAAWNSRQARMSVGTAWSLLRNAVTGVTEGFSKVLEIEGVGYKMAVEGDAVVLSIGYANPVRLAIPKGIAVTTDKNSLTISGTNKELVGRLAAEIRSQKKPEPYKGKGIHYRGEVIRRKVGKKAATAAA